MKPMHAMVFWMNLFLAAASASWFAPAVLAQQPAVLDLGDTVPGLTLATPGIRWGAVDIERFDERFGRARFEPAGRDEFAFDILAPKGWIQEDTPLEPQDISQPLPAMVGCVAPDSPELTRYVRFDVFQIPIDFDPVEWLACYGTLCDLKFLGGSMSVDAGRRTDQAMFRAQDGARVRMALWSDGPRRWLFQAHCPESEYDGWADDLQTMIATFRLEKETGAKVADAPVRDSYGALATFSFLRPGSWTKLEVTHHDELLTREPITGLALQPTSFVGENGMIGELCRNHIVLWTVPRDQVKVRDLGEFVARLGEGLKEQFSSDTHELVGVDEGEEPALGPRYPEKGRMRMDRIRRKVDPAPYDNVLVRQLVWAGPRDWFVIVARLDYSASPLAALSVQHALQRLKSSLEVR